MVDVAATADGVDYATYHYDADELFELGYLSGRYWTFSGLSHLGSPEPPNQPLEDGSDSCHDPSHDPH